MKLGLKIALTIAATATLTFIATSYGVRKGVIMAFTHKVLEMEATNEVGRIESWDRLENLLLKGCNKEALELVRLERISAFSMLKYHIGNDEQLKSAVQERNSAIALRMEKSSKPNDYQIPTCE